jgi:hypothetical protein
MDSATSGYTLEREDATEAERACTDAAVHGLRRLPAPKSSSGMRDPGMTSQMWWFVSCVGALDGCRLDLPKKGFAAASNPLAYGPPPGTDA